MKSYHYPINLYIFSNPSRSSLYGVGTYIRELINSLSKSLLNVNVVHLHADKAEMSIEKLDGITHWYLPSPGISSASENTLLPDNLYYRNVARLLAVHIEDKTRLIFHINNNMLQRLAEMIKMYFDCKIIAVNHYSNWSFSVFDNLQRLRSALNNGDSDSFGNTLKRTFEEEKILYAKMDHVISLSNYMYKILCRDYGLDPAKITVIPNGLIDMAETTPGIQFLRRKWNVPAREKIILFVGRMDEVKGLTFLIKAFRELLKTHTKCRLVIAGDGEYSQYTNESQDICTRITYTGLLDKAQLYEWYRIADVGVIPSLFEPFGYVAVEMMMHKLPVVVTATSGLNEVVDDTCGLKVPLVELPESVEIDTSLLAQKILHLLQHPVEARKMGKNGRRRYLKEYSSEIFRKNMLQLYESLSM